MKIQITKVPNRRAEGGWLSSTHGSDFDSGINWVGEGKSHEQNPLGGVQMGVDEQGIPNLVEEGEAIWNGDYVFSKRMKVPKKLAKKYGLGGDMTFADAIAKLTKDSEERPLSNIDRATNDYILGEFADTQEEMRAAKAQRAMDKEMQLRDDFITGFQFGLGGYMSSNGIVPNADNVSPIDKVEQLFTDGGDLFGKPFAYSNKFVDGGTIKTFQTNMKKQGYSDDQIDQLAYEKWGNDAFKYRLTQNWEQEYDSRTGRNILRYVKPGSQSTVTSNRVVENSTQTEAPKAQAAKKAVTSKPTTTAKSTKGSTGLNTYGYDPIETFKYWNNDAADYDAGYRDFIENKLNEDWINRVMAGSYGDMSRYKGANKANPTTDQALQLGLDYKNSDWHKAMASAYDDYLAGINPVTGQTEAAPEVEDTVQTRAADTDPENAINFGDVAQETGFYDNFSKNASPFNPKQTWTRQVPIWLSGLFGLKDLLTPADYGNADAITEAAYQVGSPISVGTEYVGDYRKRDPFDERYLMNIINQRGAATNQNMMNLSGGNRAVAMSGILSNDLTNQMSLAEAARQSYLANRADDVQVSDFNYRTNKGNADAQNQRNLTLAQLNSHRQNALLNGISMGARMRQAIKDQRDAAISANLTNFAQGLGDLGKENGFYNMLGGLNEEGVLKYFYGDNWKTKFNNVIG